MSSSCALCTLQHSLILLLRIAQCLPFDSICKMYGMCCRTSHIKTSFRKGRPGNLHLIWATKSSSASSLHLVFILDEHQSRLSSCDLIEVAQRRSSPYILRGSLPSGSSAS